MSFDMILQKNEQSSRWTLLFGIILIGLVLLRSLAEYSGGPYWIRSLLGMGLFSALYFSEGGSRRDTGGTFWST